MTAATIEVSRHASEIGWWEMASRLAAAHLRPHVVGYCGYIEETAGFTRRRELPSAAVVVVIGFGSKLELAHPDLSGHPVASHRSFVAGLHEVPCVVGSPGVQSGVQVNLTPLGAHLLFGLPMRELANRVAGLDEVLGAEAELLSERLHAAGSWEARFALLDAALARLLERARAASPDVTWAWRRLVASGGRLTVGELCAELGCSRRHMLRRFGEQIGTGPKALARIVRFERAVRMLGHRDDPSWGADGGRARARELSWGQIALDCGYFDQAHMNRDFRRLAGLTPGELAASLLPDGGGLPA